MSWSEAEIPIEDSRYFKTLNGLWTGKKPPFKQAGVIRNTNFTSAGKIDYSKIAYLEVEEKQLSSRKLEPGDIIIERSGGGPKQPVGRVVFFDQVEGEFSFSNFTSAIRVSDKQSFEPKFVFYRLLELHQSGRTEDIQRRTTGIRNLDFTAYKERARIPRLPLEEQREIARILSTVQRAVEAQERIIQTTTELKQALMQKLFSEGLRGEPQKETEIGLVPESWEVVPLADLILTTLQNGAFVQKPQTGKGFLFANVVDMYGETKLDLRRLERLNAPAESISQYWLQEGDVLVVRSSLKREGIGQSCVARDLYEPVFYDCHLIRLKADPLKVLPEFLCEYWRSDIGKNDLVLRSKTTTMTTINQQSLSEALIPVAPIDEQSEIINALEAVANKGHHNLARKQQLEDLFRTLLYELMTSKTRVKELEASV